MTATAFIPARCRFLVLAAAALLPRACLSQDCRTDLTVSSQVWVHAIHYNIRYFRPPDIPLKTGTVFNPLTLSASNAAIAAALTRDENSNGDLQFSTLGFVAARLRNVEACVRVADPAICKTELGKDQCVDVTFNNHEIRIFNLNNGGLLLPLPRSPSPTYFAGVPKPLVVFNPTFAMGHDNRTGTTPGVNIRTSLFSLGALAKHQESKQHGVDAVAAVGLSRSLEHNFYKADEVLSLEKTLPEGVLRKLSLRLEQRDVKQPLGTTSDSDSEENGGLQLDLHFDSRLLKDAHFWAGGAAARHTIAQPSGLVKTSEGSGAASLLLDGTVAETTARIGAWFTGAGTNNQGSYQKFSLIGALYKDILVATNQSFGVQLAAGYGHTWGTPPPYARFFAGSNSANFLYQSPDALLVAAPPTAIVRSFGQTEAGVGATSAFGGSAYRNLSTTVSIPIPALSRPLIPAEVIDDSIGLTLKQVLKTQGTTSAISFIQTALVNQGVPAAKAKKQAEDIVNRDIAPAVKFVADHANIYSVKPLLLFDIAQISVPAGAGRHFESMGGGVEFTIVSCAFQGGYARTLHSQPGDRKGNIFLTVQFRNFF